MKFFICSSPRDSAKKFLKFLSKHIETTDIENCDAIIALGGDGFMLKTIHKYYKYNKPFWGFNCGNVGFLLNKPIYSVSEIMDNLTNVVTVNPLKVVLTSNDGSSSEYIAVNDVSFMRHTYRAFKFSLTVDDVTRFQKMFGDGILISTDIGSMAYNYAAKGPILPCGSESVVLTPLNLIAPANWRGAILKDSTNIVVQASEPTQRPGTVYIDFRQFLHIRKIEISVDKSISIQLVYDNRLPLQEKILSKQFS